MGRGQELLDAAREGHCRVVEKLLAQINKRSGPFTSLRRGAGPNVQDDNGYTPLHHACLNGHREIVHTLLEMGASPCTVDKKGATPLHLAAFKGDAEAVGMLLEHNSPPVNVDQLTHDGDSALLIAAQFGFTSVVSQLIARGADVTIKNVNGDSALDLAAHYGKYSVVRHLLHVRPQLVDQYMNRNKEYTSTPLHRASMNGRKEVVIALLDAGMDPNVRTANGTPLHEAARYGKASVVRVLLNKGADLHAMDSKKKTVYDLLAEYPEEALRKVRKAIREYVTNAASYESDNEDLPPFPVPEYSPTPPLKTSETQKNTNKHDSFLSPPSSSLNKHHPQSFVKKLASKCLGLKAKFNSAPNISNSSAAEVDVKSKQPDNRNSTNTLLIGNSKFFKMLSKKEESGEIVCNDEFDTISLDRLGTLNRDSVVNRSNRSCPGFKTSLPNISEHNELSDSQESIPESVVITELDCGTNNSDITEAVNRTTNFNIFEPREVNNRKSVISTTSTESRHLVNECYESYDVYKSQTETVTTKLAPIPQPRPTAVTGKNTNDDTIYENIVMEVKSIPKPAARIHIPVKSVDEVQKQTLYENVDLLKQKQPEPHKRTLVPQNSNSNSLNEIASPIDSRSSTMSSDSMLDETNLEDIFLSEKSKSFRHRKTASFSSVKLQLSRTQSIASDASDVTEASALENVDCSDDIDEKPMYLSMTGTLPNKKTDDATKKKVLFRHKTFTNIEVDRNSIKIKDLPEWNNEFLKETLAHYHIRGTGHCIYNAPTVQEFIYIFNRDTLYSDVPPFTKVPYTKRDSEFETAICFCRPRPPKFHSSAEDLIDKTNQVEDGKVLIDVDAIKNRREILQSSFKCYCASKSCTLHSTRRESPTNFVVKFSAIKKSISTPDITLDLSPYSTASMKILTKNKSVPSLEEPYAVVSVDEIIARNTKQCENAKKPDSPVYTLMSQTSTVSSTTSAGPYSIKDIAEVISLSDHSTSTTTTLSRASGVQLPIRKSSSSEYSGHWSLQSCNSNVTIQSDASFKTCLEESSDDSEGTLHSDPGSSDSDSSDAETVKSDVSTSKRPWVHSDSFRFGSKSKPEIDVILEESQSSPDDKSESSKYESGICLEGSVSSLSECEDDSGIPRVDADVSLGCASLERVSGLVGGVRSGSGRRRWDEAEGTSEGDALSVSSAASSCAPLHLSHHHPYSKVSPTPPKKPPRRNLSVSPTHANSPSSGYSYELRPHARSQDDLDDIQGSKHYLKHGRSVDQYVDGKLSYSEYEENHNSPRVVPIPNPRPSLKQRSQPVAITAMYENVVIKEQNPRRKLRRNNLVPTNDNYDQRMTDGRVRKYSHQEKSSLESLLDDQSMNSPSDCERYYEGPRGDMPLSPTHYEQPPTPDHPPPSARQAENCIHERIRPLSQLIMEVVEEIRIRKMSQSDISNS